VKNGVLRPSACRPYVRPWADDDDDDDVDARCHGDDAASDVTPRTRQPFGAITSNFVNALSSTCTASSAGIYALFFVTETTRQS